MEIRDCSVSLRLAFVLACAKILKLVSHPQQRY